MKYVPIFLAVAGRRCLVVGGGEVAARKVATLLAAGAEVCVVSPHLNGALTTLASRGRIRHVAREYASGDLDGASLIYAATDDAELHRRMHDEAGARGIPINVADAPELCSFIVPAVLNQGALQIAVSTAGASPAMAKRIVARLGRIFGSEYGLALEVMRAARGHLKAAEPDLRIRARKLSLLAASRIPEYLRNNDLDAVERMLHRHLGVGLDALGLSTIRGRVGADAESHTAR